MYHGRSGRRKPLRGTTKAVINYRTPKWQAASGWQNWSLSASGPYQATIYGNSASGTQSASGNGGDSYQYSEYYQLGPNGQWQATSGSGSAAGGESLASGYAASGGCSNVPASVAAPGSAWSGSVSAAANSGTSYDYSTNSTFTPGSGSGSGWTSTGSASATVWGATDSSFTASSPFSSSGAYGGGGSIPYSGTASCNGGDNSSFSYTQSATLQADGSWAAASGSGSTSGGTSQNWSYAGGGSSSQTSSTASVIDESGLWTESQSTTSSGQTLAESGSQSFSMGYGTTATLASGASAWVQSGSGSASGNVSYYASYTAWGSGSGETDAVSGGEEGVIINITSNASAGDMSESNVASGTSDYSDSMTLAEGVWTDDPSLSASTTSQSGYTSANTSSSSFDEPGMGDNGGYSSGNVTSNAIVTTTSNYNFNSGQWSSTTALSGSGQANWTSGAYYNNVYYPSEDTWSQVETNSSWSPLGSGTAVSETVSSTYAGYPAPDPAYSSSSAQYSLADFSQTGGLWVSWYPFELPTLGTSSGLTTGGTGFPGSGQTLGSIPAVPAIVSNFGTPTLPGAAGVSSLLPGSPGSLAGIAPLPGAVGGLWGMGFTQQTVPQTLFAAGNTAGAAAGFTSETMVGAGGAFGWNNVAVVVPVTRAGVVVNYGDYGVSAGNPAQGGGVSGDDDEGDGDDADAVGLAAATPSADATPAATPTPAARPGGSGTSNDPTGNKIVPYLGTLAYDGATLETSGGNYGSGGIPSSEQRAATNANQLKGEIAKNLQAIADMVRNAKPGEEVDYSEQAAAAKEEAHLFAETLIAAYKNCRDPAGLNVLDNIGFGIEGLPTFSIYSLLDKEDKDGLYAAGNKAEANMVQRDKQLAALEVTVKVVQGIGEAAGTVATVITVGSAAAGEEGVRCLIKMAIVEGTTVVVFEGVHRGLAAAGVSEETIDRVDAIAQVAMLLILLKSACFVAGTPVLVPARPAVGPPPAETAATAEQPSDRDRLLAGAALMVGLAGVSSERRKKAKKKRNRTGLEPWFDGEDGSDEEPDYDDAWGGSQRDDLIRDLRLARCTDLDEETLEAIGSSRSAVAATLGAESRAVGEIEPAAPVAARLEPASPRGIASAVRAGAMNGAVGRARRFGRWAYLAAFLVAVFFGVKSLLPSHGTTPRVRHAATNSAAPATQDIETVRVGQRVLSRNPDSRGPERIGETAVNPLTWRHLTLRAVVHGDGDDEDRVEVETLQPPEWVEALHAFPGASVPLPFDLTEMGLPEELRATVIANESCPPIQGGEGRVVLSTISHTSACVGRLTVEDEQGRRETIRPTAFHAFYREPAGEWVTLENLRGGDRLRGAAGTLTVVAVSNERSVDRVYNMTVEGEHVYYVSNLGVLAHNACKTKKGKAGGNKPPNPWGSEGDPTHRARVAEQGAKFRAKYPESEGYEHRSNKSILNETGVNRRPDNAVLKDGKVVKVGEVPRTNKDGSLVPREKAKQVEYRKAKLRAEFDKIPKK